MACTWLAALLAVMLLPEPLPASAADVTLGENLYIEKYGKLLITKDGTATVTDVLLRQGSGERTMRMSAANAVKVDKPGKITELNLTGAVHMEFRDVTLDATSAFIVIRGEELVSVQVTGSPATFSHQPRDSARRVDGRADEIDYEAATDKVRFSGNTFWTDGRAQLSNRLVVYDIVEGYTELTEGGGILRSGRDRDRVPGPRTPDRSASQ